MKFTIIVIVRSLEHIDEPSIGIDSIDLTSAWQAVESNLFSIKAPVF